MRAFLQNAFLIECSFLGLKSLGFVRLCLQHKIRKNEEGQYSLSHLIFLTLLLPIFMLLKGGEIEGRENENPELGGVDGFVKIRVHSWFLFSSQLGDMLP